MKKVNKRKLHIKATAILVAIFMLAGTTVASFGADGSHYRTAGQTGTVEPAGTTEPARTTGQTRAVEPAGTTEPARTTGQTRSTDVQEATGQTDVTVVDSPEELNAGPAGGGEAFFTLDVNEETAAKALATDKIAQDVEEIITEKKDEATKEKDVAEYLDNTDYYMAEPAGDGMVDLVSTFATCRLMLIAPEMDSIEACGAVSAVYYKDRYLLSYENEETAKEAYENLKKQYGEMNVIVDIPLKMDSYGWGTPYMGMDVEQSTVAIGSRVTVAVVDSGINSSHTIFRGKTVYMGYDFVNNDTYSEDENGHGTAVAGVIAESTPSNVQLMIIKALDSNGEASLSKILAAIEYAENYGADIINMSLGAYIKDRHLAEAEKIDSILSDFRAMIVCPAGNEGKDIDAESVNEFPGELSSTVCVGSIDSNEQKSSFSNYGQAVDFVAPGNNVTLAAKSGGFIRNNGTSFACPYVTSAAALIKAGNRNLDKNGLYNALRSRSIDLGAAGKDTSFGYGCPAFPKMTLSTTWYRYSGRVRAPSVTVRIGNRQLAHGSDYAVTYQSGRKNVGNYAVRIDLKKMTGTRFAYFRITKATNLLLATRRIATVKKSKVRKRAQTIARPKAITIKRYNGRLTYAKLAGSKRLKINRKTGNITVLKNTKRGTYQMRVRVTAAGNRNYYAGSKYITVRIRVR